MKLLLDNGLPRGAAAILEAAGHPSIHVGDIGMWDAADVAILDLAAEEARTVVTLDSDFHALLATQGRTTPSVIWIRMEGLKATALARVLIEQIAIHSQALEYGAALTISFGKTRLRMLPIVGKEQAVGAGDA